MSLIIPEIGQILNNQDIYTLFKVGNSGGMRRSIENNVLILVTDPFKAIYEDKWIDGILHYTGMGRTGDQQLTSQNKTLNDAKKLGITVYLFEVRSPKEYTFLGPVEVCGEVYRSKQTDDTGAVRTVLVFPLKVIASKPPIPLKILEAKATTLSKAAHKRPTQQLIQRALVAQGAAGKQTVVTSYFSRNQDLVELVKRKANGICALCNHRAPFTNAQGEPYLEVHHIAWLSQGGEDSLVNTVALCPNCHRKMHVLNLEQDQKKLQGIAQQNLRELTAQE